MTIISQLRDRYPQAEGWAFMDEVTPPGVPNEPRRRFDAIAIGLWPSMGELVHGFEIKTARSDFINEINNPAKSGQLLRWCNYFWLVCPPNIAQDDEVPFTWGIIHVHESGLRIRRKAPLLKAITRPSNWWQCMLLRLCTRKKYDPDELEKARLAGVEQGIKIGENAAKSEHSYKAAQFDGLQKIVDEFETASGLKISRWTDNAKLGRMVRALSGDKHLDVFECLRLAVERTEAALAMFQDAERQMAKITGEEAKV